MIERVVCCCCDDGEERQAVDRRDAPLYTPILSARRSCASDVGRTRSISHASTSSFTAKISVQSARLLSLYGTGSLCLTPRKWSNSWKASPVCIHDVAMTGSYFVALLCTSHGIQINCGLTTSSSLDRRYDIMMNQTLNKVWLGLWGIPIT